jgi:hypothetical protein
MNFTDKDARRFYSKIKKSRGCWFWLGHRGANGYGHFRWRVNGSRCYYAHRFSYAYHIGAIPEGMHVCHKCDNPGCVNPDHLFIGTAKDNQRDASRKGRKVGNPAGRPVGGSKLTPEQAIQIRAELGAGFSKKLIAKRYKVSTGTILNIQRGITFKEVDYAGLNIRPQDKLRVGLVKRPSKPRAEIKRGKERTGRAGVHAL